MLQAFLLFFLFLSSLAYRLPLAKLQAPQAQNSFPLNNSIYYQYSGSFQIGTPAQNVTLVLDNSAINSWINIVSGNYKINQSSSAIISQNFTSIDYGLGEVSGYFGTEILAAPSLNFSNITQSLIFGSVVNNTGIMADGVLGLSNNNQTQNFIQLAVAKGQVADSLFGFFFTDTTQNNSAQFYVGSLSFPQSKPLTWINTTMTNYWSIPISSTLISVQSYTAGASTNNAIIDSASSLLIIGADAFAGLLADQVISQQCQQSGNNYICSCPSSQNLTFPLVQFVVSSSLTLTAVPQNYMIQLSGSYCLLGVQSQGQLQVIVLGDILMNNYFVGFDKGRSRVGFSSPNQIGFTESQQGFLAKDK